jgi:uncharacterized membrane protein
MREPDYKDLVGRKGIWDWIPSLIAFLAIYAVLLIFYKPTLLFSLTTTGGGDTGAHHYPAQYLINELLPHFKLTGWAPGWYDGMPMLTFYFPFPFLLIAIFNWILPYQIAFKIVTVLGVFALPATAYAFARLLRVRRPYPMIAAVFGLVMVLMQSYSIYGGNILSTLAGEFGYMLSFALVFLFLGTLHRGMEKGKFDRLFILNCLILMALVLSHIVTTFVLVFLVPGLFIVHRRWRALLYVVAVAAVGFALTAWWSLPFIADLKWSAKMEWTQLHAFKDVFPTAVLPVAGLALVGMAYAVARKEKRIIPLAWITFITLVLVYVLPNGRLWNARVLPFFWCSLHLWAAYATTWLIRPFTVIVRDLFRTRGRTARRIYVPLVAIILGIVVMMTSHTAFSWIRWNYTGYEGKPMWTQYQQINDFIAKLPQGRVMTEHSQKIDEFGTPRAFEIIPYWTTIKGNPMPTIEGTLMEASYTAPFHFINQAELSKEASNAIIGVRYPSRNVPAGLTHLQLMNIPYLLTVTPEVTSEVKADNRTELLGTWGDYNLFRVAGTTGYVEVMKNQPVRLRVPQAEWRDLAVDWYLDSTDLTTPLVWDQGQKALEQYPSIDRSQVTAPPANPIDDPGSVTNEQIENEKLTFDTTAINQPHWIKISYFPNWHVKGADGPYLASPSFMMVIPRQHHVELYYGRTTANTVGQTLEIVGWLVVAGLFIWRVLLWRRRRALRTGPSGGPSGGREDGRDNWPEAWADWPEERSDWPEARSLEQPESDRE